MNEKVIRGVFTGNRRILDLLTSWVLRHLQVFFYTLGQLTRSPFGTLMTSAVIGIALALPGGLYLLLENAQAVSRGWDSNARISVFLKDDVSDRKARELAQSFAGLSAVEGTRVITRVQALEEYREMSGFKEALAALEENPLPAVIVVQPRGKDLSPLEIGALVTRLKGFPEVDVAQFDLQWVKRFYAIMHIVQRGVMVLSALLALAVLLVVGNTIRLSIQNRRDEIEIAKLFGATDAFIRRPFLYTGFWYGFMGGIVAWFLISGSFALIKDPVRHLADLYYSDFLLSGLSTRESLSILGVGALLGLVGSWVAVGRHLGEIEPS